MPNFDGTGPFGNGTGGRGRGRCAGNRKVQNNMPANEERIENKVIETDEKSNNRPFRRRNCNPLRNGEGRQNRFRGGR